MSLFNQIVPMHPNADDLLMAVGWGCTKEYPLAGRIRYVWLSEDYKQIKILLKEGKNSWSENREEIIAQAKRHEGFVSLETVKRDPVYVILTMNPIIFDEEDDLIKFAEIAKMVDLTCQESGINSLTRDPFVIFDTCLDLLRVGDKEELDKAKVVIDKINEGFKSGSGIIEI